MLRSENHREFCWNAPLLPVNCGAALEHVQLLPMAVLLTALVIHAQPVNTPSPVTNQAVVQGIESAQRYKDQCLGGVTLTERYTVKNSHFNDPATMTVHVTYTKGAGKAYQVISRSGPSLLQRRVLDRLLEEEGAMSRGQERQRALLTSANYSMELAGTEKVAGRQCYVVNLVPKSRNTHLLKGKAWVDSSTFSLVRIEGRPSASPSFWTGRPLIVRDYIPVQGFWLAQHSRATSEGFFAGTTELDVQYMDYSVSPDLKASNAAARCGAPSSNLASSLSARMITR
jgi:hypothetical protein